MMGEMIFPAVAAPRDPDGPGMSPDRVWERPTWEESTFKEFPMEAGGGNTPSPQPGARGILLFRTVFSVLRRKNSAGVKLYR